MCKLSDKVGQHMRKRSTGRTVGCRRLLAFRVLSMPMLNGADGLWPDLCVCAGLIHKY